MKINIEEPALNAAMMRSCLNDQLNQPESRKKYRANRHCKLPSGNVNKLANDTGEIKRFYGDGLIIKMNSNHHTLKITGDGCTIILLKNSGSIHVTGDNCSIRINDNLGDIQYTGDGGKIRILGPNSSMGRIKFVGDGGQIISDVSSLGQHNAKCHIVHWNDRTNKNQKMVSSCMQRDGDKNIRKTIKCNVFNGHYNDKRTLLLDRECLDNMVNDVKEKTQGIYREHDEKCRESSVKAVAAKVITKIQTDGERIVKICFDNFSTNTSKSFDDDHPKESTITKNLSINSNNY